jgi:hypothetical protein
MKTNDEGVAQTWPLGLRLFRTGGGNQSEKPQT